MEDTIHTIDRLTVATVLLLCMAAFSVGFSLGNAIRLRGEDLDEHRRGETEEFDL